jgi:hypothetical protein
MDFIKFRLKIIDLLINRKRLFLLPIALAVRINAIITTITKITLKIKEKKILGHLLKIKV